MRQTTNDSFGRCNLSYKQNMMINRSEMTAVLLLHHVLLQHLKNKTSADI